MSPPNTASGENALVGWYRDRVGRPTNRNEAYGYWTFVIGGVLTLLGPSWIVVRAGATREFDSRADAVENPNDVERCLPNGPNALRPGTGVEPFVGRPHSVDLLGVVGAIGRSVGFDPRGEHDRSTKKTYRSALDRPVRRRRRRVVERPTGGDPPPSDDFALVRERTSNEPVATLVET